MISILRTALIHAELFLMHTSHDHAFILLFCAVLHELLIHVCREMDWVCDYCLHDE